MYKPAKFKKWQQVDHLLNIRHHLSPHDSVLRIIEDHIFVSYLRHIVVIGSLHDVLQSVVAIHVHHHIVGYAHAPCQELAIGHILALLQFGNHLDECLLKDIIRLFLVVNHKHDIAEQFHLVA